MNADMFSLHEIVYFINTYCRISIIVLFFCHFDTKCACRFSLFLLKCFDLCFYVWKATVTLSLGSARAKIEMAPTDQTAQERIINSMCISLWDEVIESKSAGRTIVTW
jgi:hypothetical protein